MQFVVSFDYLHPYDTRYVIEYCDNISFDGKYLRLSIFDKDEAVNYRHLLYKLEDIRNFKVEFIVREEN